MDPTNAMTQRETGPLGPARRPSEASDAREVLTAIFKRRRAAARVALGTLALVALVTAVRGWRYEARASVLVKYGREYVNRPEVGQERALVTLTPEEVLNSEAEILTSEDLAREVVQAVGVARLYARRPLPDPTLAAAARRFREDLSVEPVRRSSVLQIAFRHRDPGLAAQALHVLLERYEQKHLQAFGDPPLDFLNRQLQAYRDALRGSEERLEAFRQEHGVFSYDEQMRLLLERRAALDAQQRQAGVELAEIERRIGSHQAALGGPRPQDVVTDIEKDLIRQQGEARSRKARIAGVARLLDEVDRQIRELDRTQRELASLQRDVAEGEANYRSYREKVDEMTLASAMNRQRLSNVSVIDAGAVPTRPASPRLGLTIVLGLALSTLSAAGYVLVAERRAQTMSTPEAVERRLGLPVLVSVERHA